MKICSIIGARPQFIKAAMVSRAIREHNVRVTGHGLRITETLIHTGQHYDYQMSQVFFDQLEIPEPNYHLEVGSGTHGDQTGRMLAAIEKVLMDEKPDAVLVYGDTNSTLAGALAAAKLHFPVGHVEGGMRSFNRRMPEEINRVLTDHVAKWHFCATETAVKNLKNEGITEGVHLVGDVMYDAVMLYKDVANDRSKILEQLQLIPVTSYGSRVTKYALATVHRAENTDDPIRLRNIMEALVEISKEMPVVFPVHPRTRKAIENARLRDLIKMDGSPVTGHGSRKCGVMAVDPLSYIDMLRLESSASVILTDSGGMQKEAFWLRVPCVTMRDETEWVETVEAGWNNVVGADKQAIVSATLCALDMRKEGRPHLGSSEASYEILRRLVN
jgi:UDP-GlcNAc3NAcA epimerase